MFKNALFLALIVAVASCKRDNEAIVAKVTANRLAVVAKAQAGNPIKIACEGTSLTYGEDIKGTDTVAAGLPLGPARAKFQYPAVMLQALNNPQITLSLRGFPGDRTTDALTRWKDSTTADICIIEYGTNDAYNFAGLPGGTVPVSIYKEQLTELITRRLNQGAWTILCLPPLLENKNSAMIAYRNAAIKVALQLGVPVFDVEQNIKGLASPYSDVVHFNSAGYQKWGLGMAELLKSVDK